MNFIEVNDREKKPLNRDVLPWALSRVKVINELRRIGGEIYRLEPNAPRAHLVWLSIEIDFVCDVLKTEWLDPGGAMASLEQDEEDRCDPVP